MAVNGKSVAVGLLAGVVIGGTALTTVGVSAQDGSATLADRLGERFGVESSEVQSEIDALRTERKAERAEKREAYLQSLVDDGTLTADQKTALTEKFAELKTAREDLKNSDATKEERKAAREAAKADVQAWADEQGIDLEAIRGDKGSRRGNRGHRSVN